MSSARGLAFVGDVHLDRDDPDLDEFLGFLAARAADTVHLVLLGDLFNLWIGSGVREQPHQRAVVEALAALRRSGVTTAYVEGNRDYRIARRYEGVAFDLVVEGELAVSWGTRRILAVHGDLANRRDRQYRLWRRLSRSSAFWLAFRALPESRRLRFAEGLETRMRRTNRDFRGDFPEDEVRRYGSDALRRGFSHVVLGHFHVERDLAARPPSPPGRILVLPEWKGSRRWLSAEPDGDLAFVEAPRRARA